MLVLVTDDWGILCEIALRWISQNLSDRAGVNSDFPIAIPIFSDITILGFVNPVPIPEPPIQFIPVNSLRPRPNRRHFADDIFKCIFENGNEWISPRISLKFVPKVRINNIPALVMIMAWRRPGDKPLSEPMMVRLPTHICVTRPQWVKWNNHTVPIHYI